MDVVSCEHGSRCAGCAFLDVPYEAQRATKRELALRAFARFPSLADVPVAEVAPADPIAGYRTRVKWMVGPRGELGLYAREGDHVVVDVPRCHVVPASIASVGEALRGLLRDRTDPVVRALRAVDLRELRDEHASVWVTLVLVRDQRPDAAAVRRFADALVERAPVVASVFTNEVARDAVQVLGASTHTVRGEAVAWDRIAHARVRAAPGGFVQAHRGQAEAIARRLEALVGDAKPRVLDVFAGSGAWGLGLAACVSEVVAVESFEPAARRIDEAAASARAAVHTRTGDAERVVAELASRGERFDLVVVNPPRRGLSPSLRAAVASLGPSNVAYVSCDPETLARDLADFAALGLRARSVEPFDMIPLSEHVESLAILAQGPAPAPEVVHEAASFVVVALPPHGRADVGPLVFAPMPLASGLAVVARSEDDVSVLQQDLAIAEVETVAMVKGVVRAMGTIERPVDGRRARTRIERLAVLRGHSVIRARSSLADAHALPEHLAAIGHPVLGDARRVDRATLRHFAERYGLDRPYLHRARIRLPADTDAARVRLAASLPGDLRTIAERLGAEGWNEW